MARTMAKALNALRRVVAAHWKTLSWIAYALGLVWLLLHPAVTVTTGELKCRGTYLSENALLLDSGVVASASHPQAHSVTNYQRDLLRYAGDSLPSEGCGDDCSQVLDWIETQLKALDRVDVFRQQFDDNKRTNLYGVLRASPLGDNKESIVLVAHYRNVGQHNGAYSSVSIGLGLIKSLITAKWLAKDVILLLADDGALDGSNGLAPGTEAWLRGYHIDPFALSSGAQSSLPMRAGVIRAAVNLESMDHSASIDTVGIFTTGMNGQLPNLDLVNSAVRTLRTENIRTVLDRADRDDRRDMIHAVKTWLQHKAELYGPREYAHKLYEYLNNLGGMLRFMKAMVTGSSGPHANFIRYNIDSITVAFMHSEAGARPVALRSLLRSLELLVRSMSNLEEKLHQSFFLYVLPNIDTFVSVGEYYYVVALAMTPAMAQLVYLASRTIGMRLAFGLVCLLTVESVAMGLLVLIDSTALLSESRLMNVPAWLWSLVLVLSVIQLILVAVIVPLLQSLPMLTGCTIARDWRIQVLQYDELHKDRSEADSETPVQKQDQPLLNVPDDDKSWRSLKFLASILLVFGHCILGILNYPMALFCAIPMAFFSLVAPMSAISSPNKILCILWLLVSSPVGLVTIGWLINKNVTLAAASNVVHTFLLRTNVFALPYFLCLYFPVHTLSLAVACSPSKSQN